MTQRNDKLRGSEMPMKIAKKEPKPKTSKIYLLLDFDHDFELNDDPEILTDVSDYNEAKERNSHSIIIEIPLKDSKKQHQFLGTVKVK